MHRRKASWFMEAAALQVEGSMAEFHFEMGQGQGRCRQNVAPVPV
ncbi:hypothetical protein AB28_1986 [Raoultella ornithinolytica 2-156-04_S1_C2]|nr:hypothetical protein AB28_1986 [Raoultella ornithinolytica 2-156-04_S1_C2]